MDVGRQSSRVQRGSAGLVRKGLVERKHRTVSTAWLYRLTDVGRLA
jgi:predicted transcriptional regulator